jgi:hypothetical protein
VREFNMNANCLYCKSLWEEGALKCKNCGAPQIAEEEITIDVRSCPYCRRRLLALASPACNFCGLRLPAQFIKTRDELLRRIARVNDSSKRQELKDRMDEVLKIAGKFDRNKEVSLLEMVDWTGLTKLFS